MDPEVERVRQTLIQDAVMMYRAGTPVHDIAEELGKSVSTVYQFLREGGLEPFRANEHVTKKVTDVLPNELVERICQDYVKGDSVARLARVYELTAHTVNRILREKDIEFRGGEIDRKVRNEALARAVEMYKQGEKLIRIQVETGIQTTQLYKELYIQEIPLRRDMP